MRIRGLSRLIAALVLLVLLPALSLGQAQRLRDALGGDGFEAGFGGLDARLRHGSWLYYWNTASPGRAGLWRLNLATPDPAPEFLLARYGAFGVPLGSRATFRHFTEEFDAGLFDLDSGTLQSLQAFGVQTGVVETLLTDRAFYTISRMSLGGSGLWRTPLDESGPTGPGTLVGETPVAPGWASLVRVDADTVAVLLGPAIDQRVIVLYDEEAGEFIDVGAIPAPQASTTVGNHWVFYDGEQLQALSRTGLTSLHTLGAGTMRALLSVAEGALAIFQPQGASSYQVWLTDGTAPGTVQRMQVATAQIVAGSPIVVDGQLFAVRANTSAIRVERIDWQLAEVVEVASIPRPGASETPSVQEAGNLLWIANAPHLHVFSPTTSHLSTRPEQIAAIKRVPASTGSAAAALLQLRLATPNLDCPTDTMILDPATGDGRLIPGFRPHPDLIEQVASSPTHVVALRALSPREYWVWDEAAGDERLAQRPAGSLDTPGRILGFSDTDALIHGSTTVMPTTRLMRLPLAAGDVATIADPPFSDRIRQSQVFRGNLLLAMHNQHFQHHSSIPASNPLQGVRLADASYIQGPHMPGDIHFLGDVGNWLVARFDDSTSASLVRIGENVTFEFVHSFPVGATIDRADPSDALDGRAAFVVRNAAGEATLWESDGTPEGTRNLAPGHSWPIAPTGLALLPTGVLIVVPAADLGWEPWLVPFGDGDPALLVDIHPGVGSSDPMHLLRVGNRAFFSASDGIHGREPWVTDGTPEGTRMLRDVMPGARSSFPHGFFDTGRGVVLFVATDAEAGAELWAVTERGRRTWRVADIDPGPHGSEPRDFAITDQAVYFTAHDAEFGRELWRLPFASLDHLLPGDVWVLE